MRVNETLSSSGDYLKGIDFRQVFGIFDPEQDLYFNKREGVDVGKIQQRQDINFITSDTGMLEGFWLVLMQTSVQFLKLHYEFENKLQILFFEFPNCVHAAERVTGKARWNESTQNSQWTNACQHCWTWHVRNASYVFPSTNSFLVHHPSLFLSPTSARKHHLRFFVFLLNEQVDWKNQLQRLIQSDLLIVKMDRVSIYSNMRPVIPGTFFKNPAVVRNVFKLQILNSKHLK